MLNITIPNNNISERTYIVEILLGEFLGLDYKLEVGTNELKVYHIDLENGNKLIVEDHFFSDFLKPLEYLKLDSIPSKVGYQLKKDNPYLPEDDIPIIYGTKKLETKNKELKTIICGIDVFASSFFMITRWEEYVNKNRDSHNRFPATESLAFKNNFLDRPVVNEYVEMLWSILKFLGYQQKRKERNFELLLTHDVDFVYKWDTISKFLRHLAGDLIKRKSLKEFFLSIYSYIQMKLGKKNDPFDTFDYLMDISDSLNTKSHFFFMAEGKTKYDNFYQANTLPVISLVKKIKSRGHNIGIHPSYNAYNNPEQFKEEKKSIENIFDLRIFSGREHFLRFEVPTTWQMWEDNHMIWDGTVGYADKEGFRCGVCYEYSIFNIKTRKKLKLKEKPLLAMETSFIYQENITDIKMEEKINKIVRKVKKYKGEFVFLWHNSNFNVKEWRNYKDVYKSVLEQNV